MGTGVGQGRRGRAVRVPVVVKRRRVVGRRHTAKLPPAKTTAAAVFEADKVFEPFEQFRILKLIEIIIILLLKIIDKENNRILLFKIKFSRLLH